MFALLTDTGLGSCLVIILGLAAVYAALRPTKKKPGAGTPGQNI